MSAWRWGSTSGGGVRPRAMGITLSRDDHVVMEALSLSQRTLVITCPLGGTSKTTTLNVSKCDRAALCSINVLRLRVCAKCDQGGNLIVFKPRCDPRLM